MKKMLNDFLILLLILTISFCGCTQTQEQPQDEPVNPRDTVSSITKYFASEAIPVRGIGIVACLPGTGSSECPPQIRAELEKYIWQMVPKAGDIKPRAFIESQDTAVVEITGVIPALSTTMDVFDVTLQPLSSTQTTSLDGGCLYTAQLIETSRLKSIEEFARFSKPLAEADGPVYRVRSKTSSEREWRVLGGGRAKENSSVRLILNKPSFVAATAIRNRINERFGPKTASSISTSEISLVFPMRYLDQREKFLTMVNSLMLGSDPEMQQEYAQTLIEQILSNTNSEQAEIALEGIGKPALDQMEPYLKHRDPAVQFHIARCMLNIGDNRSLSVLRSIVKDRQSPYRIDAIYAVGMSAKRRDALPILTTALEDSDVQIRLKAYEMLRNLRGYMISRKYVSNGSFSVDNVICSGPKMIYVYRQNEPRIVLFGSPVLCEENIFIQSEKSGVTINSTADQKYISVSRKHPTSPRVIGPLLSSKEMSVLIQTLGEIPDVKSTNVVHPGLNIPYDEILDVLKTMSKQGAFKAAFVEGPESELTPVLQESASN